MAPEPDDDAFRRFLERATEDPPGRVMELTPRLAPDGHRPRAVRGPLLAAAAVLLVVAGAAVVLRPRDGGVVIEPAGVPVVEGVGQVPPASDLALGTVAADPGSTPTGPGTGSTTTAAAPPSSSSPPSSPTSVSTGPTSPTTGPVATAAPAGTRLSLGLDAVPVDAADGTAVTPAVGPAVQVERIGTGTMEAVAGGGRRFLPGGQQRTDHVVLTRVGADVGALLAPSGRATVVLVPQVDVARRTSVTGRNIHTWFEIVSQDGPDDLVTGLLLQVDPEIGPYFGGAINGVGFSYVLTPADIAELGAGRVVTVALEWSPGSGRLVLNGRTLTEVALPGPAITWTPTARLSVGGSASWGAGYFTARDDGLRSFEVVALP